VGIKTPEIYRLAFHSQSVPPVGANRGRYRDAELDALIDRQDWSAVTVRVHEQLPYVPLWYEGQFAAMRAGVLGYVPAADGNWDGLQSTIRHLERDDE
jgi:peptide/nickel transport system substrate-binding protein